MSKKVTQFFLNEPPTPRFSYGMCYDGVYVYVFGGDINNHDLWRINVNDHVGIKIIPESDIKPESRRGCSMEYYNGYIVLFGGYQAKVGWTNDLWKYNINENVWLEVHIKSSEINTPKECGFHSTVLYKEYMVKFGGNILSKGDKYNSHNSNELYILNLNTNKWKYIKCSNDNNNIPCSRHKQGMALLNEYIIIHGGISQSKQSLNDCYITNINDIINENIVHWIKIDLDIGYLRSHLFLTYNNKIICFGGQSNTSKGNTLYIIHFMDNIIPINNGNNVCNIVMGYIRNLNININVPKEIYCVISRFYGLHIETANLDVISPRIGQNGCIINNAKLFIFAGYDNKPLNDSYFIYM